MEGNLEKGSSLLFTASLVLFTVTMGIGIISPIIPIIAKNMGAGGIALGMIFSAFSISRLVFLPFFGKLSDRYGRKPFVLFGLSLYTLLALLYIAARTPNQLILVRLFHGMSSAMVLPVILAMVSMHSPKGKESTYMGIANRSIFLGLAFGPLIGGIVSNHFGFEMAFVAMGLISLASLLIAYATLNEQVKESLRKNKKEKMNRRILTALIYRILNSSGRGSMLVFLPVYGSIIGLDYTMIGALVFLNLIVSGLIQPYAGIFSDRRGYVLPVITSAILSSLILYSIPKTTSFIQLALLSSMLGFTSALSLPAVGGLIAVEGKSTGNLGGLMGYYSASKSLGRAIGPIIAGIVYDVGGGGINGIMLAFTFSALLTLLAAPLFWIGVKESHQIVEID